MGDYIDLVSAENGSNLEVKSGSVIITQKLAKLLDLKTGETITIKLSGHEEKEFKIGGVSKNYALHYIYITPDDFESVYGEKPVYNLSFIDLKKDTDENSFKEQLISNDEFYGISFKMIQAEVSLILWTALTLSLFCSSFAREAWRLWCFTIWQT